MLQDNAAPVHSWGNSRCGHGPYIDPSVPGCSKQHISTTHSSCSALLACYSERFCCASGLSVTLEFKVVC